jgi:DNA-binding transcriptional regulator YiaG
VGAAYPIVSRIHGAGRKTKAKDTAVTIDLLNLEPVPELPPANERVRLREKFNLTQQQLADALMIDVRTLRRWEKGIVKPSGPPAVEYAKVLNTWKKKESGTCNER